MGVDVASVSKYDNAVVSITVKDAVRIAQGVSAPKFRSYLRESVERYGAEVLAEVEEFVTLRELDPVAHAQRCLIFAICSPQCRFDVNVRAAARFGARLHEDYADVDSVYRVLTDDGADSWVTAGMAARGLFASLQFIREITEGEMDKAAILALRKAGKVKGLGMKTASMALALYDATLPVYTLDVHMLRAICTFADCPDLLAGSMTITDAAYPVLEAALVALHEEECPGLPVFVSQWAIWDNWGFGRFTSHREIFA
jgi:hypothetical protein